MVIKINLQNNKKNIEIFGNEKEILGEDSILSVKKIFERVIYHIRFHLFTGIVYTSQIIRKILFKN